MAAPLRVDAASHPTDALPHGGTPDGGRVPALRAHVEEVDTLFQIRFLQLLEVCLGGVLDHGPVAHKPSQYALEV
ncbi:MAG: hypothetical protein LBK67_04970 [Coriobacteriales bacterium]|nr:hypothetical protein [Coriobacteriales bacterium]